MLEQIAAEMKKKAAVFSPNSKPSYADCVKTVAVGDVMCKLMFTCDVFNESKKLWHLSFSTIPYGRISDETAERIKKAFFGDDVVLELPSILHGPNAKQYLSRVKT